MLKLQEQLLGLKPKAKKHTPSRIAVTVDNSIEHYKGYELRSQNNKTSVYDIVQRILFTGLQGDAKRYIDKLLVEKRNKTNLRRQVKKQKREQYRKIRKNQMAEFLDKRIAMLTKAKDRL